MSVVRTSVRSMQTTPPAELDELMSRAAATLSSGLRKGLESPTPGALLGMASMLLALLSAPEVDPGNTTAVVRGLAAQHRPEASAGALAIATLADDAGLRRWARRDLADRGYAVPRWLAELHRAAPSGRAFEISGPFRDLDDLVVGVTLPTGHPLTAVVRIDNEFGGRDVGGALFELPVDETLEHLQPPDDADVHIRNIDAADARARIAASFSHIDLPLASRTDWHSQRPLVRWLLTRLPTGGEPRVPGQVDDVDVDHVLRRFLASPWGRPWVRGHLSALAEHVLGDGLANGLGDPLLWAPHHVARLLDPTHRHIDADELDAVRTPELLRDLIRYGHGERGLRQELTDRSLREVDRCADAFIRSVRAREEAA